MLTYHNRSGHVRAFDALLIIVDDFAARVPVHDVRTPETVRQQEADQQCGHFEAVAEATAQQRGRRHQTFGLRVQYKKKTILIIIDTIVYTTRFEYDQMLLS